MTTTRLQNIVFNSYLGEDFSLSLDSKLGCNLSNTVILDSIPSTPTTSQGTYLFKSKGSTVLLNASGTGGDNTSIQFLQCSSTSAPTQVLQADNTGIWGKTFISIDNNKTSVLDSDSLTFSGVDYKALVDTHSTQIANLGGVDITELAKLSDLQALANLLGFRITAIEDMQPTIISIPIYHVPSVYADSTGRADYIPASVSAINSYSGLYYKNNLNEKINWYIQPDVGMTVGDIKGLMLNFYNVSATTGLGCPYINVYTQTDSSSPNAASWYKSRKSFTIDSASPTTINTSYALLVDNGLTYSPLAYGHTKVASTDTLSLDMGTYDHTETVLFFAIETSSNSAAGLYEFIASKFTVLRQNSTQEFVFQQL